MSGSGATGLPDVPLNAIVRDIDSPENTWFVATDIGVFYTSDSGGTWGNATAPLGLPNAQVNDLKAVPLTRSLYAATYGRGLWKISFSNGVANLSGTVTLDACENMLGTEITFEFRPKPSGNKIIRTANIGANGNFALTNIPTGNYNLAVKSAKWLQKVTPLDLRGADQTTFAVTLLGGDADDSNSCDVLDLALLIEAFGTVLGDANYTDVTDFNCDQAVDVLDFAVLVANFGTIGDD